MSRTTEAVPTIDGLTSAKMALLGPQARRSAPNRRQKTEFRIQKAELRTPNPEQRTRNPELRTSNPKLRTSIGVDLLLADSQRFQGPIVDLSGYGQLVDRLEPANRTLRFWAERAIDRTVIIAELS
jgi:hypothetical protein